MLTAMATTPVLNKSTRWGLAGLLALVAVLGVSHLGADRATAQSRQVTTEVVPSFRLVQSTNGEIASTTPSVSMEKVVPLGADNVFLTIFNDRILVFRADTGAKSSRTVRLGEITLKRVVRDLHVLDDKRTFVIYTADGASVYAVTRENVVREIPVD
jgi:hypothetical protein